MSEETKYNLSMEESDYKTAVLQSVISTEAMVEALARVLISRFAKNEAEIVEVLKLFSAEKKKANDRLLSELRQEKSWNEILD